jgi:hypothetical protein
MCTCTRARFGPSRNAPHAIILTRPGGTPNSHHLSSNAALRTHITNIYCIEKAAFITSIAAEVQLVSTISSLTSVLCVHIFRTSSYTARSFFKNSTGRTKLRRLNLTRLQTKITNRFDPKGDFLNHHYRTSLASPTTHCIVAIIRPIVESVDWSHQQQHYLASVSLVSSIEVFLATTILKKVAVHELPTTR